MQSVVRVLRALLLLGSVWAALGLVGWATGAIPPSAADPSTERAAADAGIPPQDAGVPADATEDAAVDAALDADAEAPPPLPSREVTRFTACGPDEPTPTLAVLRVLGDPRPEIAVGCGPLVQVLMAEEATRGMAPVRVVDFEAHDGDPGTRVRASAMAADDVDGDSTPDLLLGFVHEGPEGDPRGGALHLVRGHASGAFEAPERLAPIAPVAVATAPLTDGPGADVVALHQGSLFARRPSEIWVFAGGPAPARTAQLRTGVGGEALAVADLDRDGQLDLVSVAGEGQRVDVFFGAGGGRFPRSATLSLEGGREAVSGDLSGDGEPDVLVQADTLALLDYESKETLRTEPVSTPDGFRRPRVADLDGDGRPDILGVIPDRGVVWLRQTEPGVFEERPLLTHDAGAFETYAVEVGDLDANGQLDAVVLGRHAEGAPWELWLVSDLQRGAHLELSEDRTPIPDAPLTLRVALQ